MASIRYALINNKVIPIHKVVIHSFEITQYTDLPNQADLWNNSSAGIFVHKHKLSKLTLIEETNYASLTTKFAVIAELEEKN